MSAPLSRLRRPAHGMPGLSAVLLLVLALGACTSTPPRASAPPAPPATSPTTPPAPPPLRPVEAEPRAPATRMQPPSPGPLGGMLAYADRVRSLSAAELAAEIARLNEAAQGAGPSPNAALQMQQAIALAQTRTPADLARALGLVQRVANDGRAESLALQPLARLLAARYMEQRRVEDERDRTAQQLKDAQRRIDQLNDRLEALRAIERSFGRPAPAAAPPRPGTAP